MSDNVQPPPKRYVVGLDDYYRKKTERNARRANGEHNMAGLPVTDEDRLRHVEEMVVAFRNLEGIVDSPEDKIHIEFARDIDEEEAQMKAWEYLIEIEVAQGHYRETSSKVVRAEFKDWKTRWDFNVALFKGCKAAVYNAFQASITERFANNPATELNTKLSNLYTNAVKSTKQKIAKAVETHGSASFDKVTRELKDANGNVIAVYPKPQKRNIADVLGPELAKHAKVKHVRRAKPKKARAKATTGAKTTTRAKNTTVVNDSTHVNNTTGVNNTTSVNNYTGASDAINPSNVVDDENGEEAHSEEESDRSDEEDYGSNDDDGDDDGDDDSGDNGGGGTNHDGDIQEDASNDDYTDDNVKDADMENNQHGNHNQHGNNNQYAGNSDHANNNHAFNDESYNSNHNHNGNRNGVPARLGSSSRLRGFQAYGDPTQFQRSNPVQDHHYGGGPPRNAGFRQQNPSFNTGIQGGGQQSFPASGHVQTRHEFGQGIDQSVLRGGFRGGFGGSLLGIDDLISHPPPNFIPRPAAYYLTAGIVYTGRDG